LQATRWLEWSYEMLQKWIFLPNHFVPIVAPYLEHSALFAECSYPTGTRSMNYQKCSIGLGACALLVLSALRLSAGQPPAREDFIKYPSLRQKWSAICDPRSNLAEVNAEGCEHLHQWTAASEFSVLDNLMNQNLGK
jgi:hypothetical protein